MLNSCSKIESDVSVKNSINIKREMKQEQQDWIKKIIDYETQFLKEGECSLIASKTKRIIQKNDSRLNLHDLILGKKNAAAKIFSNYEETINKLILENTESFTIQSLEKYSCDKSGFMGDSHCSEYLEDKEVYSWKKCLENTDYKYKIIQFSAPVFDVESSLILIYRFEYCGALCARGELLIYEVKNDKIERKSSITLFVS